MKKHRLVLGILAGVLCLTGFALLGNSCSGQRVTFMDWDSTIIKAPPEEVFALWQDPEVSTKLFPGTELSREGEGLGRATTWTSQAMGTTIKGKSVCVEFVPDRKITDLVVMDGAEELVTWIFLPHEQGTRLIVAGQINAQLPPGMNLEMFRETLIKSTRETFGRIKAAAEK